MQSGRLLTLSGQEVLNPLAQVDRSLVKLKQLFIQLKIETKLTRAAVFVNPSFHLYNADVADAYVFPGQLADHLRNISQKASHLSKEHHLLAERLLDLDKRHAPYEKELPAYDLKKMKKQLNCPVCGSPNLKLTQRTSYCEDCNHMSTVENLCLTTIADLRFLFPDKKTDDSHRLRVVRRTYRKQKSPADPEDTLQADGTDNSNLLRVISYSKGV